MPIYFFHIQDTKWNSDAEGLYLEDDGAARREAIRTTSEMVRDCPEDFWGSRPWSVTVTDAAGSILYEISMNGHASRVATE